MLSFNNISKHLAFAKFRGNECSKYCVKGYVSGICKEVLNETTTFYKTLTSIYCCMQSKCIVNWKVNSKVQSIMYQSVGILSILFNSASSPVPIMDMQQDCFNVLCHIAYKAI